MSGVGFHTTVQHVWTNFISFINQNKTNQTAPLPSLLYTHYRDCIFKKMYTAHIKQLIIRYSEAVTRRRRIVKKSLKNSSVR